MVGAAFRAMRKHAANRRNFHCLTSIFFSNGAIAVGFARA
jgi:hypothetical protein